MPKPLGMTRCKKGGTRRRVKYKLQYGVCLVLAAYFYYVILGRRGGQGRDVDDASDALDSRAVVGDMVLSSAEKAVVATGSDKTLYAADAQDEDDMPETRQYITPSLVKGEASADVSICKGSWKSDWDAIKNAAKPKILLDPHRFIYPVLANGPNNQLIGLRDTIYLAIRLNRTLIIPHFYKHKSDSSSEKGALNSIPASQRVDVAAIASLISVVPFKDLQTICSDGFDDLFFTSYGASHVSLHRVSEDLGFPIHAKNSGEEVGRYPKDMDSSFTSRDVKSDKESLRALYDSPGMCALYAFPFRTVGTKENMQSLHKTQEEYFEDGVLNTRSIDPDSLQDKDLYSLIVHSTHQPKHISAIVDSFLHSYQLWDVPYLSVHWRYDVADWQTRCRKEDRLLRKGKEFMIEMCRQIQAIEPADVAETMFNIIMKLERQSAIRLRAVYFAAPLTMEEFVSEVKTTLYERFEAEGFSEPFRVFTHADLHNHMLQYSSCEGVKENYEDIFSQLEMDVCSKAAVFLRSPTSSWSQVVCEMRIGKSGQYDDNVFDRVWEVARKRLGS